VVEEGKKERMEEGGKGGGKGRRGKEE